MDIIIAIIFIVTLVIVVGIIIYFELKETKVTKTSKSILFSFKNNCKDDLDELIKFSKTNNSKYKI